MLHLLLLGTAASNRLAEAEVHPATTHQVPVLLIMRYRYIIYIDIDNMNIIYQYEYRNINIQYKSNTNINIKENVSNLIEDDS